MSKKPGRPKLDENEARGKFISTRVSPPEYQEIAKAVRRAGAPKTEWVRTTLLSAARNTTEDQSQD
jgi:hypothetical protein